MTSQAERELLEDSTTWVEEALTNDEAGQQLDELLAKHFPGVFEGDRLTDIGGLIVAAASDAVDRAVLAIHQTVEATK